MTKPVVGHPITVVIVSFVETIALLVTAHQNNAGTAGDAMVQMSKFGSTCPRPREARNSPRHAHGGDADDAIAQLTRTRAADSPSFFPWALTTDNL